MDEVVGLRQMLEEENEEKKQVEKKPVEKKKKNGIAELVERIKGKTVVIYGESWVGKTTLAYAIARRFNNALYLDTDHNYDFPQNNNVTVLKVDGFGEAIKAIENNTGDVVVVDSVSGLIANLFEVMGAGNPRTVLISSQSQERLVKSAKKNFKTVIIIAHVGADFRSGGERVRMNQSVLRYVDTLIRVLKMGDKRVVKVTERKIVEEPDFNVSFS